MSTSRHFLVIYPMLLSLSPKYSKLLLAPMPKVMRQKSLLVKPSPVSSTFWTFESWMKLLILSDTLSVLLNWHF
jgi:hypothetical protein